MLITAFHSPRTAAPCRASIPGSMFLACYFASRQTLPPPVRLFGSAASSGLPRFRQFLRLKPVADSTLGSTDCLTDLHSPLGVLPPSGSKRSTGLAARQPAFRIRPISLRSPQPVPCKSQPRITVPGPLRFRRLAVPQTSWNLIHYAL